MESQPLTAPAVTTKHRVFVVDDHPIFRRGLAELIASEPDFALCGEASSSAQALDRLRSVGADAAVLDISLPGADGLELLKQVRAEHPTLPILMLSVHDEAQYALRALRAGAGGYVMKKEAAHHLTVALRKVVQGEVAVSDSFGKELIYKVAGEAESGAASALSILTDRELEILRLIGEGQSSRSMAASLHLSIKTIESHRLHIKSKLSFPSSKAMVRFAIDWVAHSQSSRN